MVIGWWDNISVKQKIYRKQGSSKNELRNTEQWHMSVVSAFQVAKGERMAWAQEFMTSLANIGTLCLRKRIKKIKKKIEKTQSFA